MNILEILKGVPKGTKLYSPIFGNVEFEEISGGYIRVRTTTNFIMKAFQSDGKYYADGECMLFPSRENRDWSTSSKLNSTTLKPFDKVLVRDNDFNIWKCELYSHYRTNRDNFKYACTSDSYNQCIPYNDETKHLVGTDKGCPEYYKTW